MRIDTLKLHKGWETLVLPNPGEYNGTGYGMIPLESTDDTGDEFKFVIFGGIYDAR